MKKINKTYLNKSVLKKATLAKKSILVRKKRLNVRDLIGVQKESLQFARRLERLNHQQKKSAELLKKTAHLGEYLAKKKRREIALKKVKK